MSLSFTGKVAIVTGAAAGIGLATASKLAELGAAVALLDRDGHAGQRAAEELTSTGRRASFFSCDVSRADEVERCVNAVAAQFGGVDVLVSNAGIQRYGNVVETSEQLWDDVMSVNLKGCFLAAKYAIPQMIKRGGGAVVVVGSVQSLSAVANSAAYVTSKHALLGLTRSIALDYAANGVRVNCVCPGSIDTPMLRWAAGLSADPQKVLDTCASLHPLGRTGSAEEVANAIAFLASDMASFITGAALLVDGGMLVPAGGVAFQQGGTGSGTK